MNFVELNRSFVPLREDQEPNLHLGRIWGRKIGGWLDWNDLRERRRVVLLAEALSGKSQEFQNQEKCLNAEGAAAFYLRIEELADNGFDASLDVDVARKFDSWRSASEDGWFFLDSIDEARLNRKSFESALKRFARELDTALERSHVFISCRVSDWKGPEDRASINLWLPAWEKAVSTCEPDDGSALLDPIFSEDRKITRPPHRLGKPHELLVVQLVPLSKDQYRKLASIVGIDHLDEFVSAIIRHGLDDFAERPGDLLDLAVYWKDNRQFSSYANMIEHSVTRKLRDTNRPDNATLSLKRAYEGATRLAAALAFGKSFTLRVPHDDPDPSLGKGALDAALILNDWSTAECDSLLRRGIFAPATYGRIRFHHRSSQEYLTAKWLDRLLTANCTRSEVWKLLFANRYGVETIVPSLRPVAAWLSLWHPEICDETIRREPLPLLRHGDPGSLPLDVRRRLLAAYAAKHKAAEISDDNLDERALWLFAHQGLADAIHGAWSINQRPYFRFDLLRLIREGGIKGCVNLACAVALDGKAEDSQRIIALQALKACDDREGLSSAARNLMEAPEQASAQLAVGFALVLYPSYLATNELLTLVSTSKEPRRDTIEGFPYHIAELHDVAPNTESRTTLAHGLAELCLSAPFVADHQRISKRYHELAQHLDVVAQREAKILGSGDPLAGLVKLIMAVERADPHSHFTDDEEPNLSEIVRANAKLNYALFWADVEEQRANGRAQEAKATRYWQIYFAGGNRLWELAVSDLPALCSDLLSRPFENDKRIALSAIVDLLARGGRLEAEAAKLRSLATSSAALREDLDGYLAPRTERQEERRFRHEMEQARKKTDTDKASWVKFSEELRADPTQLSDPTNLVSWKAGMYRFWHLTRWLRGRTRGDEPAAARQWRLLEEGFGRKVAEAYRDGMTELWRVVAPARPERDANGAITVSFPTILAFAGIGIEATEHAKWAAQLTNDEAERAAKHGCLSERGYPEWIETLANSHPQAVLPTLEEQIALEWSADANGRSDFLNRYNTPSASIQQPVQQLLLERMLNAEVPDPQALNRAIRILRNLQLNDVDKERLVHVVRHRFDIHSAADNQDYALGYLAALLLLEPDSGINDLAAWLGTAAPEDRRFRVELTIGRLFDRHDPLIIGALARASVPTLERLLQIAYANIRPEDDKIHEGSYTPDARDHAESARDTILSVLLDRPGADAFRATLRAADHPDFAARSDRFRELARGKAERDAEPPAWTVADVVLFEKSHMAPVKTGDDLLQLVLAVLNDIALHLAQGDATSRPLLERAKNEDEVQNWLVEQLQYLSRGRFHAYREAEIAQGNKPDIIVASTSAACEVAIEVKHGGMGWTARQLEQALRNQLAADYLKPATRRRGVLVITHHRDRCWLDPLTREPLSFDAVIAWLSTIASELIENECGSIEVKCVGINAWRQPTVASKKPKRQRSKSPAKRKSTLRPRGGRRPPASRSNS